MIIQTNGKNRFQLQATKEVNLVSLKAGLTAFEKENVEAWATGLATNVIFYGTYHFNSEHKIVRGTDFFDIGGLLNAVQKK